MLDINLLRNDPERVKENIRKKFQDQKLPLVDEVVALDKEYRESRQQADGLRNQRKTLSKQIGGPAGQGPEGRGRGHQGQGSRPGRRPGPPWSKRRMSSRRRSRSG